MPRNSVAIRIGTEGKATVIRDFAEIADGGSVQAQRLRSKWESEVSGIERATERANKTAQRLAAVSQSPVQQRIGQATSTGFGDPNGSAARSAQVLAQQLDQAENEARQLIAAIDPLFGAQMRYGEQVARINALKAAGAVSGPRYIQLLQAEEDALQQATMAQQRHAGSSSLMRAGTQNAAFQVQDMATQLSMGTRVSVIAAQQLPQLAFAISMIGEGAEASGAKMGRMGTAAMTAARFMTTLWGAAITGGILLLTSFIPLLMRSGEGHERAGRGADDHRTAEQKLRDAILEQREALEQQLRLGAAQIEQHRRLARQALDRANAERQVTKTLLEQALAHQQLALSSPNEGEAAAAVGRVAELEQRLARIDREMGAAAGDVAAAEIERVRSTSTDEGLITRRFEIRQHNLEVLYRRSIVAAGANVMEVTRLTAELAVAERTLATERAAALRAVQQQGRGERSIGATISEADARSIIAAIGGTVTDGRRTPEQNRAVGGVANSYHLQGQALDIALTPGMSKARIRDAFRSRGASIAELLGPGDPGHDDHFHVAWRNPDDGRQRSAENRAETLRRQAQAMEEATRGALALARAYLTSGEAAIRADAAREGATDATRRGTEVDAQQARQLALNVAEGAARGAQQVRQLEDENAARSALTERMLAGNMTAEQMNRALQDEAALRPLLQLQAVAQGDALTLLTDVIERYRRALEGAHAEEARAEAAGAIRSLVAANDNARRLLSLPGGDAERSIEAARIEAEQTAREKGYQGVQAMAFVGLSMERARLQIETQRADQLRQINRGQDDSLQMLRFELGLGRMGEAQRESILRLESMRLDLQRQFGPEHQAEIRQILQKAAAEDEVRRRIEQVRDAQREVEQVGGNIIDELLDPSNWDDWGEMGMRVLRMLLQEMMLLAAINPLKNALFGQNNPTIGGVLQVLGVLGSGGSYLGNSAASYTASIGGHAAGTHHAAGGLTWLAENGPELVSLPRGSKVTPAAETRRLLAANDGGIGMISIPISIDATGADAAALARVQAELADLKQTLPARVVEAWEDARQRFMIR